MNNNRKCTKISVCSLTHGTFLASRVVRFSGGNSPSTAPTSPATSPSSSPSNSRSSSFSGGNEFISNTSTSSSSSSSNNSGIPNSTNRPSGSVVTFRTLHLLAFEKPLQQSQSSSSSSSTGGVDWNSHRRTKKKSPDDTCFLWFLEPVSSLTSSSSSSNTSQSSSSFNSGSGGFCFRLKSIRNGRYLALHWPDGLYFQFQDEPRSPDGIADFELVSRHGLHNSVSFLWRSSIIGQKWLCVDKNCRIYTTPQACADSMFSFTLSPFMVIEIGSPVGFAASARKKNHHKKNAMIPVHGDKNAAEPLDNNASEDEDDSNDNVDDDDDDNNDNDNEANAAALQNRKLRLEFGTRALSFVSHDASHATEFQFVVGRSASFPHRFTLRCVAELLYGIRTESTSNVLFNSLKDASQGAIGNRNRASSVPKFVCAERNGKVLANRIRASTWEAFGIDIAPATAFAAATHMTARRDSTLKSLLQIGSPVLFRITTYHDTSLGEDQRGHIISGTKHSPGRDYFTITEISESLSALNAYTSWEHFYESEFSHDKLRVLIRDQFRFFLSQLRQLLPDKVLSQFDEQIFSMGDHHIMSTSLASLYTEEATSSPLTPQQQNAVKKNLHGMWLQISALLQQRNELDSYKAKARLLLHQIICCSDGLFSIHYEIQALPNSHSVTSKISSAVGKMASFSVHGGVHAQIRIANRKFSLYTSGLYFKAETSAFKKGILQVPVLYFKPLDEWLDQMIDWVWDFAQENSNLDQLTDEFFVKYQNQFPDLKNFCKVAYNDFYRESYSMKSRNCQHFAVKAIQALRLPIGHMFSSSISRHISRLVTNPSHVAPDEFGKNCEDFLSHAVDSFQPDELDLALVTNRWLLCYAIAPEGSGKRELPSDRLLGQQCRQQRKTLATRYSELLSRWTEYHGERFKQEFDNSSETPTHCQAQYDPNRYFPVRVPISTNEYLNAAFAPQPAEIEGLEMWNQIDVEVEGDGKLPDFRFGLTTVSMSDYFARLYANSSPTTGDRINQSTEGVPSFTIPNPYGTSSAAANSANSSLSSRYRTGSLASGWKCSKCKESRPPHHQKYNLDNAIVCSKCYKTVSSSSSSASVSNNNN